MKPVFVTGGSGMLGSALIRRLLAGGHSVRALARSPSPFLESLPVERVAGDLSDAGALARAMRGCGAVFHVAGLVSYRAADAERMYQANVVGTQNVMAAALEAGVERVVHTSSTAAVGLRDEPVVIDETEVFDPRFRRVPYMWMKHLAEVEVQSAVASGLDVVTVNPSTILGAGDVNRNAGRLFEQLARGRIRFAPPGGNSVVSLDDAVTGHLLALERGRAGQRYILSAENVTNRELLSRISRVLGRGDVRRVLPRWTEAPLRLAAGLTRGPLTPAVVFFSYRHRWFSAERAKEELGWVPASSLEAAAADAARWYFGAGAGGFRDQKVADALPAQ